MLEACDAKVKAPIRPWTEPTKKYHKIYAGATLLGLDTSSDGHVHSVWQIGVARVTEFQLLPAHARPVTQSGDTSFPSLRRKHQQLSSDKALSIIKVRFVLVNPSLQVTFRKALVSIKHFLVCDEALQDGGDTHFENVQEHVWNKIRHEENEDRRTPQIEEIVPNQLRHQIIREPSRGGTNEQFANNQNGSWNIAYSSDPGNVAKD